MGAGYSNPPFVTFPIPPNPGGVQAQGSAVLGGSVGILLPGGTVNLRPISGLQPGQTSCGATPFVPPAQFPQPEAGPGLSNQFACYIQVVLPPNMLTGAPQGAYTGTFTLLVPAGTLNSPSNAPETVPPSPAQVITFQPQTITITVNVTGGGLLLTSPWVSNNFPYITNPPLNLAVPGISVCEGAPIGGVAGRCVAPFSIPEGFTGQIEDNNSGLGNTIPGITANNLNFSNVNLDTRNLGTTASTPLTATQIPFDLNMTLAMTETHLFAFAGINGALPIPTCTTTSPVLPAANLQTNFPATVPASNAVATITALTIRVVNTAALANGYYSFAFRFATTNGAGATVFVDLPGCVSIGNHFRYDYLDDGLQPPQRTSPSAARPTTSFRVRRSPACCSWKPAMCRA